MRSRTVLLLTIADGGALDSGGISRLYDNCMRSARPTRHASATRARLGNPTPAWPLRRIPPPQPAPVLESSWQP